MALCAIGYEIREVLLKRKPQALLDISPQATVPALQLPDGRVINESLDIMLWALGEHDPEQWLTPPRGGMDADMDAMAALIERFDTDFKYHLDRYKYPQRYDDGGADHYRRGCAMLADVALFPFVRQFAAVDRQGFDALPLPHLQAWLEGWLSDARFQSVIAKHAPWQPGDAPLLVVGGDAIGGAERAGL